MSGAATASFSYDADGKQVIGTVNGVTTYYVGNHYEVKSGVVTKYYTSTSLSAGFAGATRLAVRTGGTLSFLVSDHLGSSSVTTDANGAPTASALYKAFGETRYTLGNLNTDYHFTGQRDEPSLGIYWFQSRWYDSYLNRFTQPDSIVPTGTQGTQAWDRYAFVNNNPVRYNDPTGHMIEEDKGGKKGRMDESSTELDEIIQEEANPIESYCGENSTLGCISMALQDATTLVDLVGVGLIEVPLVAAGCFGGGLAGCLAGEAEAIAVWNVTGNPIDIALSWSSTFFTFMDDVINNGGMGENTVTSVSSSIAGMMAPTPSTDLIIDTYASGYNHGFFNGILSIGNGASLLNR